MIIKLTWFIYAEEKRNILYICIFIITILSDSYNK